jgi:hypothetical protein
MNIRTKLVTAVTTFDRTQAERARKNPRLYYNSNALTIYLGRVDDIMADIEAGATPHDAVCAGFTPGPLRKAALKALGLAYTGLEMHGSLLGLPVYKPASER